MGAVICTLQLAKGVLTASVIAFPVFVALAGVAVGLNVGFGDWVWWNPHIAYGEEDILAFKAALMVSFLCGIVVAIHPPPLYIMRVERNPSLRCRLGKIFNPCSNSERRRANRRRRVNEKNRYCEFYPIVMAFAGLSMGLWTAALASIGPAFAAFPWILFCFFCGMWSRFSRFQLQRLLRICMGQILYDVIEEVVEAVDLSVPSRTESGSDNEIHDSEDDKPIPEDEEYWQGADTDYGSSDEDDNDQDKLV